MVSHLLLHLVGTPFLAPAEFVRNRVVGAKAQPRFDPGRCSVERSSPSGPTVKRQSACGVARAASWRRHLWIQPPRVWRPSCLQLRLAAPTACGRQMRIVEEIVGRWSGWPRQRIHPALQLRRYAPTARPPTLVRTATRLARGASLLYLPPYSPELNLIEVVEQLADGVPERINGAFGG